MIVFVYNDIYFSILRQIWLSVKSLILDKRSRVRLVDCNKYCNVIDIPMT